jgi:hypothetical protein
MTIPPLKSIPSIKTVRTKLLVNRHPPHFVFSRNRVLHLLTVPLHPSGVYLNSDLGDVVDLLLEDKFRKARTQVTLLHILPAGRVNLVSTVVVHQQISPFRTDVAV